MADTLPSNVRLPDPRHVSLVLQELGWRVVVYSHPDLGIMHNSTELPDHVWLEALGRAGMHPVPCLACFQGGDGNECVAGRCRHPGGLVLPPSANWRAPS